MKPLREARARLGLSQRQFAARARLSFRTIQLLEKGEHDARLSTLAKIARALGRPESGVSRALEEALSPRSGTLAEASAALAKGPDWKGPFFDFVDGFRRSPDAASIGEAPAPGLSSPMLALLASTVEELCAERGMSPPLWCAGVRALREPWFVSGMESLKASALAESPARFRRRNIFTLSNFLERA